MFRRDLRDDRGTSALELSIVAPVVVLLIFSTVQFALWLYGRNVALQSAREGVSRLRLVDDADAAAGEDRTEKETEAYAQQVGRESLLDPKAVAEYDSQRGRVRVTVTGHVVSLVPSFTMNVTRTATGEVERFEEDQ
jgi:Flp pilus assembly protein TadG